MSETVNGGARTSKDFLNGVPELLVLRLLERRPMYGYELVQEIRIASAGQIEFGEGCIYPLLHKLKRAALLSSRRDRVGGRTRVVYRTTDVGRKKLRHSISHWESVKAAIQVVLHGGTDVAQKMV